MAKREAERLAMFVPLVSSLNNALALLPTAEDAAAQNKPYMAERIRRANKTLEEALDVIQAEQEATK